MKPSSFFFGKRQVTAPREQPRNNNCETCQKTARKASLAMPSRHLVAAPDGMLPKNSILERLRSIQPTEDRQRTRSKVDDKHSMTNDGVQARQRNKRSPASRK
eukprot:scaffold7349_cov173-Amphora_coffeaeformis.AAC.43